MRNLQLLSLTLLLVAPLNFLYGQEKPSDLINQLPEIFTGICSAKSPELQSYSEKLEAFTKRVQVSQESLYPLKTKAQGSMKINPYSNNQSLEKELAKVRSTITAERDFSEEFDKALHNDAEKEMNAKIEKIGLEMKQATDGKEILTLSSEIKKAKADYCQKCSPHYIELVIEQRAILKKDLNSIVKASDLQQKISCNQLGYIYFPELSYEEAYLNILRHLNNITFMLIFAPGD